MQLNRNFCIIIISIIINICIITTTNTIIRIYSAVVHTREIELADGNKIQSRIQPVLFLRKTFI